MAKFPFFRPIKLLSGLVLALVLAGAASADIVVRALDSPQRIKGQYIVTLEEGHLRSSVAQELASTLNGKTIAVYTKVLNGFAIRIDDTKVDIL